MAKKTAPKPEEILSESAHSKKESGSGKYVFDRTLGRLVKVSDRIPGVSNRGGASELNSAPDSDSAAGPCGRSECGGGSCAMDE